jgi:acetyltransferase
MTVRNLNYLFRPQSIVLIGASERPQSPGLRVLHNLRLGGFAGPLYAVNPKYREVSGLTCYHHLDELPEVADLAVIVTPPNTVPRLIKQLAQQGTRAAVVVTAGLDGSHQRWGSHRRQAMLDVGRSVNFRILGPGSLGVIVPPIGLNASCAQLSPQSGRLALVAQSGAVMTAMIDWAAEHDVGFSHLVALGGKADIDFGDTLNYLADDYNTNAILLYIESLENARKFMSAARAAARIKPVVVLKAGRYGHRHELCSDDEVYNAVFARAGLLRVDSVVELFDMATTLAHSKPAKGERLGVVTNSSGMGLLAVDALFETNGRLAEPSRECRRLLESILPRQALGSNPIDLGGDAPPEHYVTALDALQKEAGVDAVLVIHSPQAGSSSYAIAEAIVAAARKWRKPLLTSWVGNVSVCDSRELCSQARIPDYASPAEAVRAFMHMVRYRHNRELLMETPPMVAGQFSANAPAAAKVITGALADGRGWLTGSEAREVLEAYSVPTVPTLHAIDADQAARHAASLGEPVALKIASPDIRNKSEFGGVILDLHGPEQVGVVALGLEARMRQRFPRARIDGFTVQPMVKWSGALELLAGVVCHPLFGPVIVFGHGGTAADLIDDRSVALPPLNLKLARELIKRTRVAQLLSGYRNQPAADVDALALTLLKLSQIVVDSPHIIDFAINPLLISGRGVLAMDTQVALSEHPLCGAASLAIRPYPQELEEHLHLRDGQTLLLRPIRAEDEPALQRFFDRLNPEEVRLRFHHPMKVMDHHLAARLTQLDYDRDMALALVDDAGELHGVVRLSSDPDRHEAEYAIIIARALAGSGLGRLLMERIIAYARNQGIAEVYGSVLNENEAMLALCTKLGFVREPHPEGPSLALMRLIINKK